MLDYGNRLEQIRFDAVGAKIFREDARERLAEGRALLTVEIAVV